VRKTKKRRLGVKLIDFGLSKFADQREKEENKLNRLIDKIA